MASINEALAELEAERSKLQESITLHHPTPPGSVSPTDETRNITFSADETTPAKKKVPPRRKSGNGYANARKSQRKKDPPVAAAQAFTTRIVISTKQTQALRGIKWTGFGTNHLPRHYPSIPAREAEEKAKEEELSRRFNQKYIPGHDPVQYLVHLIHAPTGIEFAVPRELLRGPLADIVAQGVIDSPGEKLDFDLQEGTPAGISLYVHVLIMGGGKVVPSFFHGAWQQLSKVHPELEDMSWIAVLLSALITARELKDEEFEKLVVNELAKAGREVLAADASNGQ
ncbi:hypothetical protein FKW77_004026 [Venturia effusa]|uniref:Uncharacterized protein n=1 Tax=Venturia effusa TaxID=50376 RepID=A0A517LPZ2_9PEZI|nr:hypothetical protein FKW77_004026 [Venturia effusa]